MQICTKPKFLQKKKVCNVKNFDAKDTEHTYIMAEGCLKQDEVMVKPNLNCLRIAFHEEIRRIRMKSMHVPIPGVLSKLPRALMNKIFEMLDGKDLIMVSM